MGSNFNLQQSINAYISLVRNQGSLTGSDAAELTAHLYDATEELKKRGLSEEEAFTIACKRLGNENVLTEEYSKVNTSINTNKIWAYLFIGYNLLYAFPSFILIGIALLYTNVYQHWGVSDISVIIITSFHLLFIVFVWKIVKLKNSISRFIEKQVHANAFRIVALSFLPLLLEFLLAVFSRRFKLNVYSSLNYPIYEFQSRLTEFSLYMAVVSIMLGILSLVFSINRKENLTIKGLLEKPSILFLVLFGIVVELMAASTRVLQINRIFGLEEIQTAGQIHHNQPNILGNAIIFGLVYLVASFLISLYNKQGGINKYLLIFSLFGVVMETSVGISADISRGDTYYTAYFVSLMLVCILLGRALGLRTGNAVSVSRTT